MVYFRSLLLIVSLGVALCRPVLAWSPDGHELVADIAWTRLSDTAKRAIGQILMAGDPAFRPASLQETDVRRAFDHLATLPDEIKGNRTTLYETLIPGMNARFWPDGWPPDGDREALLCKSWHYYDTPLRIPAGITPTIKPSSLMESFPHARAELARLRRQPEEKLPLQCWWLAWIEHLVGDAHQPLHCAESWATGKGDAGGNLFKIQKMGHQGRALNLHGYWDEALGFARDAEAARGLPNDMVSVVARWSAEFPWKSLWREVRNRDVRRWIAAHAKIADESVYTGIAENEAPSAAYEARQATICRRQAVLAGYRLAAILNDLLSD